MRPIDADKLKAHYAWWGSEGASEEMQENKKTFDTIIGLQPTLDVELIKHGWWIEQVILGNLRYKCSICGRLVTFRTQYCSACGARMDGKEKMRNEQINK